MRIALAAALVLVGAVAHADVSMPVTSAEPRWVGQCEARLEAARQLAADEMPLFKVAHVYGADLYLDENILGSATPVLFEAGVLPTREPALVAYKLERWFSRGQMARVYQIFEPAVDDCVRMAKAD
jgi:hypothetical protein